jgi:hypothetical protein
MSGNVPFGNNAVPRRLMYGIVKTADSPHTSTPVEYDSMADFLILSAEASENFVALVLVTKSAGASDEGWQSQEYFTSGLSTQNTTHDRVNLKFHNRGLSEVDPVARRRLAKLETFDGDSDLGFEKPDQRAVAAAKRLVQSVCRVNFGIKSPSVSPAPNGEVLLSWKMKDAYFKLQFSDGEVGEWAFKLHKPISGEVDVSSHGVRRGIRHILYHLLNPTDFHRTPIEREVPESGSALVQPDQTKSLQLTRL